MLEKLLLVRHFVTFEVTQLTCHDMTGCDPEIRIIDLFSRTFHVLVTTRVDWNGNDCYEWQRLFQKWQRLFQMATTVYERENCAADTFCVCAWSRPTKEVGTKHITKKLFTQRIERTGYETRQSITKTEDRRSKTEDRKTKSSLILGLSNSRQL